MKTADYLGNGDFGLSGKVIPSWLNRGKADRSKSGSSCGANAEGGGGFQPGNTCGREDGAESGGEGSDKVLSWAKEKFGDEKVAENFARWFGDSKVVDEDGNPLVVYHGTPVKFTEFIGRSRHSAQFKEEVGTTFFTADKDMGRGYAGGRNEPMSVYLNMQNPHVYDANGKWWTSVNFRAIKAAREGGNDGVIIRNVIDTPAGQPQRPHDVYITFKPTQIKSATGNSGTFDPDNPNITKSGSGCGANQAGGGGFRAGNTCGKEDGGSGDSGSSKVRQWAEKKFKDKQTAENFVKWFGDSKVVDADGNPLTVYHGTDAEFTEFKIGDNGTAYFTPRSDYSYIENSDKVIPAYLSLKNPYFTDRQRVVEGLRSDPETVAELKAQGYDGVIYAKKENLLKGPLGWGNDYSQIVAFSPNQIKSATGNSGKFDPSNPDITKAAPSPNRSRKKSATQIKESGRIKRRKGG